MQPGQGFNQNLLNDVAGVQSSNVTLRDYIHAAKTFRTNSYENAPKLKFLFHTYFSINPVGYPTDTNFGLLVKEVKLPQFSFNTVQMNQYNRKRIIQTKIKYEPIEINFHDDNANHVTQLWESYYRYYYNDTVKPGNVLPGNANTPVTSAPNDYNSRNIYDFDFSKNNDWGFSGGQTDSSSRKKVPFFKNITVFGFNQHNFTAYTLVNPIITSFGHDTYNYAEGGGIMTNRMSIDYETVVYNYGNLDGRSPGDIVTGFGDNSHYDREVSPIAVSDSNGVVLGQGGLIQANGGSITSLTNGNPARVAEANAVVNTVNEVTSPERNNGIANTALNALLRSAIQTAPINRNTQFNVPTAATTPSFAGLASQATIGALFGPPIVTSQASVTSGDATYQNTTPGGAPVPTTIGLENQVNPPVGVQYAGKNLTVPFARGLGFDTPFNSQNTRG